MRDAWRAGVEIDASAEMMRLALQIVARTLFNSDVTQDVQRINDEVNAIMRLYNFLIALPRAEDLLHLPIPGLMRFRRARRRLDKVVYRMIEDRRGLASIARDRRDPERGLRPLRRGGEQPALHGRRQPRQGHRADPRPAGPVRGRVARDHGP